MDGFLWQDYLEATRTVEVPHDFFRHVEDSLHNLIDINMSLEVPLNKKDDGEEPVYWVATIVVACGPLLRLKYFGANDKSLEFWFNLTTESAHELGWCTKNDKRLEPPPAVLEKSPDCSEQLQEFLTKAKSIPIEMLNGDGLSLVDRIKVGMKVEVSDICHPYKLWVATIKENIGGRLLLQYDSPGSPTKKFWMFCTSEHIHQYGFASKANSKWFLEPASSIIDLHFYEDWKELLENGPKDLKVPENLFNNSVEHSKHNFQLKMKVEAVSPSDRTKICPATIVKIFDDTYFLVHIDIHNENPEKYSEEKNVYNKENTWLCAADHPYIFPVGWAKKHNLNVTSPPNWYANVFDWKEYLKATNAIGADESLFSPRENAADIGFQCGMMLETVDPQNENVICASHITRIVENLIWVKLDSYYEYREEHIEYIHSYNIFPVGWCDSNHYPIKPPKNHVELCRKIEVLPIKESPVLEHKSSWCPKIYFNYRCFTGPMISKGKLATLPKSVGPGPVLLVMKEVLSMIVNVGYRSARILKVLQCDTDVEPDPGYEYEIIKAKHNNVTYRASVAIIRSADMVTEFCQTICKKLHVCPNLFGPVYVSENECSVKCHRTTKNKFISTTIKNGKRGKSKSKPSPSEEKQKPWGKRKRKRGRWANRDKERNEEVEQEDEATNPSIELGNQQNNHSDNDMMDKNLGKNKYRIKQEVPSSNGSDESRSSFNDPKNKDGNDSPSSSNGSKMQAVKSNNEVTLTRGKKREKEWDTSLETDNSDPDELEDEEHIKMQKKQRRPKTRKLDSNPLYWTVDDVFRYLRKTTDCKELAHRIKQEEIDGLAFLLLNLPSLTEHMKLKMSSAMKLCRHVEQVKVTYFLRYLSDEELRSYRV